MDFLITGGSGFLGRALAETLLKHAAQEQSSSNVVRMDGQPLEAGQSEIGRIIIYSRGEHRQAQMAEELDNLDPHGKLRFFIGDVRDRDRLRRAMEGVDHVTHAAALKRIEVGHYNPVEMVKTNVNGAINVIECAQDTGPHCVVCVSSDKAWQPVSAYGQSKALAESLFLAANNTIRHGPRFGVCRYGNVWKSQGSVVPRWQSILAETDTVPITDPDCTRFFMRIEEAVTLVLNTKPGDFSTPRLPAYRLGDLAEAMGAKMEIIGLPGYEKMHEGMDFGNTSDVARRMTVQELKDEL